MFTIKNVSSNGDEEIFSGSAPLYVSGGSINGFPGLSPSFSYTDANSEVHTIRSGKVYVMNDSGRTVASYDLGSAVTNPNQQYSGQQKLNAQYQNPAL